MTFLLTNWTFTSKYVTMDLETNILTNDLPTVQLNYPTNFTSLDPFYFDAVVAGIWDYRMTFERWTMFDGVLSNNGKVIPHFPTSPSDTYEYRNQRNVSISYDVYGYRNIEYDPTGLFSIFAEPLSPPSNIHAPHKNVSWCIALIVIGAIIIIVATIAVLSYFVEPVRKIIRPFTKRSATTGSLQ